MAPTKKQKRSRRKHVPQRTCIICRKKQDKRALNRVVRLATDEIVLDPSGKQNGRGAYICSKASCWQMAVAKPQLLGQALKTAVSTDTVAQLAEARPQINQKSNLEE